VNNVLLNANRGKKIDMIKYKLIKNEDIVLRDIHQNFFLINIKEKFYEGKNFLIRINEVGKLVWGIFDETDDIEVVCNNIIDKYSIPIISVDFIKADIDEYCNMLIELEYLRYVK